VRQLRELARELGRDDLLRGDAARVKLFDAAELVWFEPLRVSLDVTNLSSPPKKKAAGRVAARAWAAANPRGSVASARAAVRLSFS
jgi:hypothetical protein